MNEHVALKMPASAYDVDFHNWTQVQARLLRSGQLDRIDIENIAEEIENVEKSDGGGIESQLVRLIAHLLKLHVSDNDAPRGGWRLTVAMPVSRSNWRFKTARVCVGAYRTFMPHNGGGGIRMQPWACPRPIT